jgi:hypothetical protein
MAFRSLTRVKFLTPTVGTTSPLSVGAAAQGFLTPAGAGCNDGDVFNYVIEDAGGVWEVGNGTYAAAGPTLNRGAYISSAGWGTLASLSGNAVVYNAVDASWASLTYNFVGFLGGLGLSNDATSPNTVLDIAAGAAAADLGNGLILSLQSAFTKSISGTWVAGSGANGLDTGAVAANTWYHVFLIGPSVANFNRYPADILFSLSATAPALPANYATKRRIGSFKTNASSQIIGFLQDGDTFIWTTTVADVNTTLSTASHVLYTLSVPPGLRVEALFRSFSYSTTTNTNILIEPGDMPGAVTGVIPGNTSNFGGANIYGPVVHNRVLTNTSAQIRANGDTSSNVNIYIATYGWVDRRGQR